MIQPPSRPAATPTGRPGAWPRDQQDDLVAFYGPLVLGSNGRPTAAWESATLTRIELPYRMQLSWDPTRTIGRLTCHRLVADSLKRIFTTILYAYGSVEAVSEARLDRIGGCYEFRRASGTNRLSPHAFGAAVDLDPEVNLLGKPWEPDAQMIPQRVVRIFAEEGWNWGGNLDPPHCAHFQAAVR
jgi:hypothetical protein